MRRLPWHVAVRADRNAVLTSCAVALGVAFCVVSFGVPTALRTEAVSQDGPYAHADAIVSRAGTGPWNASSIGLDNATTVRFVREALPGGDAVTLASLDGVDAIPLATDEARPGPDASAPSVIDVNGHRLRVGAPETTAWIARSWLVVPRDVIADAPTAYVIAHALPISRANELTHSGYAVSYAPGIAPFFEASASEVARDLLLVATFSSTLVCLFTYEFLRSEIHDKWRELGLWRSLGMDARDLFALLLARGGAIASGGIASGFGIAFLTLLALGRATGSRIFVASLPVPISTILAVAFLAAAAAGALVPAWSASRSSVLSQLEGVE